MTQLSQAVEYYRTPGAPPRPAARPPVDATGDEFVDAYLSGVFDQLCRKDSALDRVQHLHDKARQLQNAARQHRLQAPRISLVSDRENVQQWADQQNALAAMLVTWASDVVSDV